MIINDKIYGKIKINEPVILELLETPQILRLKGMSNYGIPDRYYHYRGFSRYGHGTGVMILLKKLGATLEEQVAGLLHDVSHFAFSHVADWVFSNGGEEELADTLLEKFIRETGLAKILKKFNFSVKRVSNGDLFPLLERKIPDLCVDRVDYALRELRCSWGVKSEKINNYLKKLINFNNRVVFTDQKSAFNFAKDFLRLQTQHWANYETVMRYDLFSQALKIALEREVIFKGDFLKDEESILKKLEESNDKEIGKILSLLKKKKIGRMKKSTQKRVYKKFRHVDPKVLLDGRLIRVSKIYPEFGKMLEKEREINRKGFIV